MKDKKEYLDEILNENEVIAIQRFQSDEIMREAVKKVFLFGLYYNGTLKKGMKPDPTMNFALGLASNRVELKLTNEQIGEQLGAAWEGINLLELAFREIAKFKSNEPPKVGEKNPAR